MTKLDLLNAILPNVAFDGWSEAAFRDACTACGMTVDQGHALCPRGAVDLAVFYHERGDQEMRDRFAAADVSTLRYSEKVARLIEIRLEVIDDPEAVQRATSMFALPHLAPLGARLIWGTADAIWDTLGDTSTDSNWYTKRATLSAVWSSVILFWLGDQSESKADTRDFIDRRIDNVMQFEKTKARIRENKALSAAFAPLTAAMSLLKAPVRRDDLPGSNARR